MDTTITLKVTDVTSAGMAASALSLARGVLEGSLSLDADTIESVVRDLRNLRNLIIEAQHGN